MKRWPLAVFATALFVCSAAMSQQLGPGNIARGERAFQKCYSCHALDDETQSLSGPHLRGIVGRRIAAVPGFEYSAEMRAFSARQGRWTPELLERFIADPQAIVPDNEMGYFGISDPQERTDLVAFLRRPDLRGLDLRRTGENR